MFHEFLGAPDSSLLPPAPFHRDRVVALAVSLGFRSQERLGSQICIGNMGSSSIQSKAGLLRSLGGRLIIRVGGQDAKSLDLFGIAFEKAAEIVCRDFHDSSP